MFSEQTLESVFSRLIEPPAMGSLDAAKQRLQDLGALTADERLTPLGYHLACLPVDVRIGKLMLFGAIFRCLDPALTIAASLAFKSPFVRHPLGTVETAYVSLLGITTPQTFLHLVLSLCLFARCLHGINVRKRMRRNRPLHWPVVTI